MNANTYRKHREKAMTLYSLCKVSFTRMKKFLKRHDGSRIVTDEDRRDHVEGDILDE